MFVGVSWYNELNRKNTIFKKDRSQMNCLELFNPNEENWPYGWEYLQNDIRDWGYHITEKIVKGEVFDYIRQKFEEIIAEIDEQQLRMP